jgi:hypothetical protein
VEPEEMAVVRQWTGKHIHMAMSAWVKIELLGVVFNMQSISYQILDM